MNKLINQLEAQELLFIEIYLPICYQIFDGLVFDKIVNENGQLITLPSTERPPLLSTYVNRLNDLNGNLNNIKSVNKKIKADELKLTMQAKELIEFIEREYQLE